MKKIMFAALSLGAIAGMASCAIGGGQISESDWNAAKEKLFNLADSNSSRYTVDCPLNGCGYIIDASKIEYHVNNGRSAFASWTEDPDLGNVFTFYLYSESDEGYLQTVAGKYSLLDFDEFGGYVSFLLIAAMVKDVEYSAITHEKTDSNYHVAVPVYEDTKVYLAIDKSANIVGYGPSASVNSLTFGKIGNKSVTLPEVKGAYPDPTV